MFFQYGFHEFKKNELLQYQKSSYSQQNADPAPAPAQANKTQIQSHTMKK